MTRIHCNCGPDVQRGSEKVSGRQPMWGIFRQGTLLALYPIKRQAEAHWHKDDKSWLSAAHLVEDTGFRFRVLPVNVVVADEAA